MRYSEQFMEHIEYAFAAFCKIVLRNAAISAYRDLGRKQKHEVSLDYLMSETSFEPFATDNYFEQYVYEKPTVFVVQGKEVVVTSKRLADALANLSEQRRTVLLMNFFLGYSERKIGNEYKRSRSAVNYWKLAGIEAVLSCKLDAPAPCRLDAPDFSFVCHVLADCLHQHWQAI